MVLANYLLGGSSTARLPARVREKEGLSYSTYTSFSVEPVRRRRRRSACRRSSRRRTARASSRRSARSSRARCARASAPRRSRPARRRCSKRGAWRARRTARSPAASASYSFAERTFAWDIEFEKRIAALTPGRGATPRCARHVDLTRLSVVKAGDFKKPSAASSAGRGFPPAAPPGAAAARRPAAPRLRAGSG